MPASLGCSTSTSTFRNIKCFSPQVGRFLAAAEGMWKLIRKESEGFQRSVGAAPDDDESDDEAQPRTQTRASAFSRISETLRNRPRVSGDRDDGTVENLGDHVPLPAFDPNAVISRRTTVRRLRTNAQELGIPLRLFLIKLMLAEMTEKKTRRIRQCVAGFSVCF